MQNTTKTSGRGLQYKVFLSTHFQFSMLLLGTDDGSQRKQLALVVDVEVVHASNSKEGRVGDGVTKD